MTEHVRSRDRIAAKIQYWRERVDAGKAEGQYFFNQPVDELISPTRVRVNGRELLQFASYSYLGLLGHPRLNAAAQAAIDEYGTGTHGVRLLAGQGLLPGLALLIGFLKCGQERLELFMRQARHRQEFAALSLQPSVLKHALSLRYF